VGQTGQIKLLKVHIATPAPDAATATVQIAAF
jgi:hypothetical protein